METDFFGSSLNISKPKAFPKTNPTTYTLWLIRIIAYYSCLCVCASAGVFDWRRSASPYRSF